MVTRRIDLADFLDTFDRHKPWVLFVGSVVSVARPSETPSVGPIIDALLDELGSGSGSTAPEAALLLQDGRADLGRGGEHDLLREDGPVPFEVVLGEIAHHTGTFVGRLVNELIAPCAASSPNANHGAIAALLLGHYIDLVVTTNFDEHQEAAEPGLAVLVPASGSFGVPASPGYLKLHGTRSQPETLAIDLGALAKRDTTEWRESVASALRGRNVMFVGYGFHDPFDIGPALRIAAKDDRTALYVAARSADKLPDVALAGVVVCDLYKPSENVLSRLAERYAGIPRPGQFTGTTPAEQHNAATDAVRRAVANGRPSIAEKLAAMGALYYWLEEGTLSARYFGAAHRCPGSHVDLHTLARAEARARNYLAATRMFDRMLATELPTDRTARTRAEIEWSIGAGHCASTGGRVRDARRYYRRAIRAYQASGLSQDQLGPSLADQLLRSQAEHEISRAQFAVRRTKRAQHLRIAARYLDALEPFDVALPTRPLLALARARIAMQAGDRREAHEHVQSARARIVPLQDRHAASVSDRLDAVALRDRTVLWALAKAAWSKDQRLEALKIVMECCGLDGTGPLAPLGFVARNACLAAWDRIKDQRKGIWRSCLRLIERAP